MKTRLKLIAALKIWVVIYPALTLFLYLFKEPMATMPIYFRTLLMTITLVPFIVFIGVPSLDYIISAFAPKKEKEHL